MLQKIALSNFRNFSSKEVSFSENVTIIVGPNGIGKTNILESVFLLSLGKSFRAKVEEEMIRQEQEIARIGGLIEGSEKTKLEVILTRGFLNVGRGGPEKVARKKLLVGGVPKRLVDFAGKLKTVLFAPTDLGIITDSPSVRRGFLDNVLSLVDREYRRALLSYEKGLRARNRLLFRIREEGVPRSQLIFWDRLLIKNGNFISTKREEFLGFCNERESINNQKFEVDYDKSVISESRLEQYKEAEVASATTLVGPHRDDFLFFTNNHRDLSRFGSRGEQRMGVLWIKLAELAFIQSISGEKPVLLLDDIFSELDHEHREIVIEVAKNQQTIISTAEPHYIEGFGKVEIIELE